MGAIITLTTDFGLTGAYVAAMKGVILSINPEAKLVDICHTIKPQSIHQAAFILSTAYQFFPGGTIHMVVVDPGVGTERKAIILRTPAACFIAPDNGVLSYVIQDFCQPHPLSPPLLQRRGGEIGFEGASPLQTALAEQPQQIELGAELEAVAITKPRFWRSPVSPTFHGRDIFAPVAARLSLGLPPIEFGEIITSLTVLPLPHPYREADGSVVGHIIYIDSFGNLITDIKSNDLPQVRQAITVKVGNRLISGLSRTYGEGNELLALIGSSGYLEVSLKGGSACAFLSAEVGDEVKVRQ